MSHLTRNDEIETPKRKRGRPKKRTSIDKTSPVLSKSPKSEPLSPTTSLANNLNNHLNVTSTPPKSKFSTARRALADNSNLKLPGRESQFEELTSLLNDLIENKASASIYINGPPGTILPKKYFKMLKHVLVLGTGKTATLMKIVKSNVYESKLKIGFINATSISSAGAIYKKICNELDIKVDGNGTEKECLVKIEKYFSSLPKKTTLLILDEIDQLCSSGRNQNVLYHIFEWPTIAHSKIILIGIANSLDLTDRLLTRLQAKCELKPRVMHFPAYTKAQIVDIFKSRLEESDLFPAAAIQLLAAKVASISGDVRRALNLAKRVVEIAEFNKLKTNKDLDLKQLEDIIIREELPKKDEQIQLKEVVGVLNAVYGTSQALSYELDDAFPLQQKILICTMLLIMKHDKNKDITIGKLHEVYKKVCRNRNIQSTDLSEFVNLCLLAETKGIVRLTTKKEPRFFKIHLQWNEDEVFSALKDKQMITNIISEKQLLNR